MKSAGKNGVMILGSFVLLLLCSSCTEDQRFAMNSEVFAKCRLRSETAMKGKLMIDEAYLKLDRIHVNGSSGGKNVASVTHTIPAEEPPYQLNSRDSANLVLKLPTTAYEQLDFDVFLYRDNYQLVLQSPQQQPPVQGGNGGAPDPIAETPDGDSGGDDEDGSSGNEDPQGDTDQDTDTDDDGANDEETSGDDDNDGEDGGDNDNGNEGNKGNDNKNDNKNDKDKDDNKNNDDNKGDGDDDENEEDEEDDDDDGDDRQAGNENGIIDLQHFFQNAKPALVIFGTYNYNNQPLKVIFAVTSLEKITVRATQDDNFNVILTLRNFADISFDPEAMFSSISSTDIESASAQTYQGQQVLFIHKDHNASLYERLLSQLEASTTIEFLAPTAP